MCGIAGFTHNARCANDGVIRRMTAALTHRGPDGQGCYLSLRIDLGAVRLRVPDLQHGEQPLFSDDGKTVIVYNGEIYKMGIRLTQVTPTGCGLASTVLGVW